MLALRKLFIAIVLALTGTLAQAQADLSENPVRANLEDARSSYIFVFQTGVAVGQVEPLARRLVQTEGGQLRHTFSTVLRGFSAHLPAPAAARLAQSPLVAYYEPNGVVWAIAKPPWAGGGGDDTSSTQVTPWGITRVGGPKDGTSLHAWVIDTGIDLEHADLNVGSGANFVLRGKNSPDDGHGHGTHVAGTIAAIDNSIDVVGVAAGATVHPIRVLDNSGSGTVDGVVAGVDYVAAHASVGDCANMSLGASGHFQSLHDAVANAAGQGIYFAVAAGNDSADASDYEPAHVEHMNVFTQSAIDSSDVFAGFSNYGNPPVDFAAPGVSVLSTKKGGGTTKMSGTSMATPHVCGLLLYGPPNSDGTALDDPDGQPDPIAHY
ncbi:S8 family peptidase [Marinobacter sp. NP-4(2019)]|uniref:S8 family serine peptidase n=1 Tax=Marinobacter sp. NP-4(2019) TaxID=2488665 RepID=UPI000FC3D2E0|nr:S8 family serine peptidase [Marinobacter sp. NP-4(2019)]AZT83622.1 S8 family peptidase [Marinobacter sp. NP-4(2019)]